MTSAANTAQRIDDLRERVAAALALLPPNQTQANALRDLRELWLIALGGEAAAHKLATCEFERTPH